VWVFFFVYIMAVSLVFFFFFVFPLKVHCDVLYCTCNVGGSLKENCYCMPLRSKGKTKVWRYAIATQFRNASFDMARNLMLGSIEFLLVRRFVLVRGKWRYKLIG
jgi:hypothetical protein